MSEEKRNETMTELETALAALEPQSSVVDRDRVMFLAGRASANKSALPAKRSLIALLWPLVTVASLFLAVTFAAMLLARGKPQVVYVEKSESVAEPHQEETSVIGGEDQEPKHRKVRVDYLKLRRLVLTEGVDALPSPEPRLAPNGSVPTWMPGRIDDLEAILGG